LGLLLAVRVHGADIQDRDGAKLLLESGLAPAEPGGERPLPKLEKVWADGAYAGTLEDYVKEKYAINLEIVRRSDDGPPTMWVAPGEEPTPRQSGFKLLKHRWIVERTFGWLGRNRRLSKDYEHRPDVSETWIHIGMSRLMLRRLAHAPAPTG